jgi:Uma2 family endonuclease
MNDEDDVMAVQKIGIPASEFDQFIALPENADRSFELIGGEIVEVVSNGESSALGAYICGLLAVFARQHKLGYVTGADGGYMIGTQRYIPDCAFMSAARQAKPTPEAYNSIPPDLAVEVLSPSNTPDEIAIKVDNYLRARVVVWVVNPDAERVTVHRPDAPPQTYGINDTLDGGNVLPSFTLPVRDIFPE